MKSNMEYARCAAAESERYCSMVARPQDRARLDVEPYALGDVTFTVDSGYAPHIP